MKAFSGMFNSWSCLVFHCCRPVASFFNEKPLDHDSLDNSFAVVRDEPLLIPPPKEQAPRKRRGSRRRGFLARKKLSSSDSASLPRRPRISPPSNFRHIYSYSDSLQFPDNTLSQSKLHRTSFRPLELNITLSDTQLSPILPHLNDPNSPITPPPRAYTISSPSETYSPTISHERSYSSMSFHIPRRPVNEGSVFDSLRSNTSTPQRPQLTRTRDPTSPPPPVVEDLVKRVANAMLERDRLQEQLEDIIERQSIHVNSRPSTAHGQPEMEPMPGIPVMPPNAPSFSERVSSDCPRSTSAKSPTRTQYQANSSRKIEGRSPPPLPLRLRPPLRKKKSFPTAGADHKKESSLNSPTDGPKPITDGGFHQVAHPEPNQRSSFDSESTVSDWTVEDDQTTPASISPGSVTTPRTMARPPRGLPFGWREPIHFQQRENVALAF
ncbi:hypothetical protein F4861DRAFT_532600 [Xylaria intraflava]|nr:hypothetical protein F4861DRAFT_532600 [Xylaria intraflava]